MGASGPPHRAKTHVSPRLLIVKGPFAGQSFTLTGERFTIGRQADNDLQLRQLEVSRRHCVIRLEGDHYAVEDLDSRRGIFVNALPIRRHQLEPGDVLTVGGSELLFLLPSHDHTETPAPADDAPWPGATTLELRPTESIYLQPGASAEASPREASRARDLDTLYAISRALQQRTDAGELAAELLSLLLEAVPADRGGVLLCETDGSLRMAATRHRDGETAPFALSRAVTRRVRRDRIAVLATDVRRADDLRDSDSLEAESIHSLLCVPLVRGDQLLGALYFDVRRPPGFSERHLELTAAAAVTAALALDNACHVAWLRSENRRLRDQQLEHGLVGESPAMRKALALLARVAPADSTVLLRGESGTGKELAARAIHRGSRRAEGPFVAINCASLSETLLESELFGHEKGAFTGASARQLGKLEAAHGGTLFLDEMGEIPPALQARLLRVLQERTFERVGGHRPITVDLRLVAATNRDLEAAIRDGRFREDLFYRINVITVNLPPLRKRQGDVALLARYFTSILGQRLGRAVIGPSPAALALLEAYAWPGNVRQLVNVIERAVVLGDDELIHPEDLPEEIVDAGKPVAGITLGNYNSTLTATKKALIRDAFTRAGGDYGGAAEILGVHVNSLHRLIRNLGLKAELAALPPRD